jgi:hypothetical protein
VWLHKVTKRSISFFLSLFLFLSLLPCTISARLHKVTKRSPSISFLLYLFLSHSLSFSLSLSLALQNFSAAAQSYKALSLSIFLSLSLSRFSWIGNLMSFLFADRLHKVTKRSISFFLSLFFFLSPLPCRISARLHKVTKRSPFSLPLSLTSSYSLTHSHSHSLSLSLVTRCDFVAYGQGMQKTLQRFFML